MATRSRHPVFRRTFPFLKPSLLVPLLTIWIVSTAWLIVRFRALDSDSIMYGLPLAFSHGPFSLGIPMLGDFPPYSSAWGHQWPGAMILRGALYAVVPFQRLLDISLLLTMQAGAALLAGYLVWRLTLTPTASICTMVAVFSDRVVIAGLQLHRWEAMTNLALVSLLLALVLTSGKRATASTPSLQNPTSGIPHPTSITPPSSSLWLWVSFVAALVAACTHPFGMAVAMGFVGMAGIDWLILRRRPALAALVPAAGLALGLAGIAAYFAFLPEARAQFFANIALQNSFNAGSRLGFFTTHLRYYHWLGYPLWVAAAACALPVFLALARRRQPAAAFAAWALPLAAVAVPALFILTRSANNSYAVLGTPFAMILVAVAAGSLRKRSHPLRRSTALVALGILAAGFFSVYPYRWLVFFKAGCPDFPAEMNAIINRAPAGATVYIPPPLWDVARQDNSRNYRLYTLSVASPRETRLAYEQKAFAGARPGDVLVIDRISGTTGDPWGILPTYETLPPDARFWNPAFEAVRRFPGAGHDFGYDLAVYEFRGVPWDPASTPRQSISGR